MSLIEKLTLAPATQATDTEAGDWIIGKRACLDITIARLATRCKIVDVHWKPPYHWMGCHYQDGDDQPFIPVVNTAGGLVEGDDTRLRVSIGRDARALFLTVGSTKHYKCLHGGVTNEIMEFTVAPGALLEYVPDETIPYRNSRARRNLKIWLSGSARLFFAEVLSAGRIHYGNGERFEFKDFVSSTEIAVDGEPLVADRLVAFDKNEVSALAEMWGGYSHLVTIYIVTQDATDVLVERLRSEIRTEGRHVGISRKDNLVSLRILAAKTWSAHEAIFEAWCAARPLLAGKNARIISKA